MAIFNRGEQLEEYALDRTSMDIAELGNVSSFVNEVGSKGEIPDAQCKREKSRAIVTYTCLSFNFGNPILLIHSPHSKENALVGCQ